MSSNKFQGFTGRDTFWWSKPASASEIDKIKSDINKSLNNIDMNDTHPAIREACMYSVHAGGKRVRAILILLLGRAINIPRDRLMPIAISAELLHNASIILDDIMDQSVLRRGCRPVYLKYGKAQALAASYYLVFKAMKLVMGVIPEEKIRSECVSLICRFSVNMIEGQWHDLHGSDNVTIDEYIKQIYKRSGQFFECGAVMCARIGCSNKATVHALQKLGAGIGVLFQLRDDVLDYMESRNLGKPPFRDFETGKLTAPTIVAIKLSPDVRKEILLLLGKVTKTKKDRIRILDIISHTGAFIECGRLISLHARMCRSALSALPDNSNKKVISDLIEYLCCRVV